MPRHQATKVSLSRYFVEIRRLIHGKSTQSLARRLCSALSTWSGLWFSVQPSSLVQWPMPCISSHMSFSWPPSTARKAGEAVWPGSNTAASLEVGNATVCNHDIDDYHRAWAVDPSMGSLQDIYLEITETRNQSSMNLCRV